MIERAADALAQNEGRARTEQYEESDAKRLE
jgi:hypothetical protein